MKTLLIATVMGALAWVPASAQSLNLDFSALASKARAKNEVTLDSNSLQLLRLAGSLSKDDKGKGKTDDISKVLSGIEGVVVRNYEFEKAGEYADRDLDPLRAQVGSGSGWSRIVNVKESDETTEIYVHSQSGKADGMLLIAAEAKELTVVHISGSVQLAQLQDVVNSTIHYDLAKMGTGGSAK
jgi:hypothetical protein